jgi:competence/damage-inducible protein CinA-like protein
MRAEVIAIGDELTTGQRLDTNSQWLSQRLTELGVSVKFHTTVADDLEDNAAAFRAAIERADVVVCTGGLGPTADDLTRNALAAATGVELVRDESVVEHVRQLFARRGRAMPERNAVQGDFPIGSSPIPNRHGTAPGIEMEVPRGDGSCTFFALPGVPAEMHEMWETTVSPRVLELQPEPRVIRHRRIKCFGVGESHLEAMLPDLIRRGREPRVGITVADATITLRVTSSGNSEADCFASMEPTIATIHQALGQLVFGTEDDELEHAVVRLLADRGQRVTVAEWATGGLVTQWLSAATDGASPFIPGVAIASRVQLDQFIHPDKLPAETEPHESAVASALAVAASRQTGADYALGIAAFPPETDGPDAHVNAALITPFGPRKLRFPCAAHPAIMHSRTAKQALNALRLTLTE